MPLFLKFCLRALGCVLAFYAAIILLTTILAYAPLVIPAGILLLIFLGEWDFYKRYGQHFHGSYASVKHTERGE